MALQPPRGFRNLAAKKTAKKTPKKAPKKAAPKKAGAKKAAKKTSSVEAARKAQRNSWGKKASAFTRTGKRKKTAGGYSSRVGMGYTH